jgi:hypothetical protein
MAKVLKLEEELRSLTKLVTSELLPRIIEIADRKPILLYSLHNPNLKLKEPLAVYLEHDKDQTIAFCYDLDLFGYGETEGEALEDLRKTISDLYYELKGNRGKLGPLPKKVWDYLSTITEEI